MADVNAEIGVSIDTSSALAQLKLLQREISRFHTSVVKSTDAAALAQRDLQKNFINGVNSIRGFSAELRTVRTTAENFTDSLERNKFSMREYFRYAGASTRTFGRFFKSEFDTVNKVAVENVKRLQTQYIKMGRDANGAMRAIAVMPTKLDMSNMSTQIQMAAQRQAIFNQLVKQGSTNLLNFGKNTQWAGRQLMVGFTIPLIGLGTAATRTFMDMETAAIKFKKVYGDLFTAPEETQFALESIQMLGQEFTKYGIAVSETVGLAAEAAAAGFAGADLQAQVTQASRLQVLGQIDQQKALETTISLQNAFRISSEELADAINFLNAVENQTVVSLDDITTAVPKAAPIIQELGGDVKDLAFFMAAMKEGGINASEGANALKSGLASLINPTDKAAGMLKDLGIDINDIVERNVGNVKQTVIEFAQALDGLSSLSRQRAIEQLFGKFQQARLSALFDNVIRDGNQASRVLDLASASMEELASLAERELGLTADSAMNKFRASVETLKLSLVPLGQAFLEVVTPLLEKLNGLLEWFGNLSDTSKQVITKVVLYVGGLAPVLLMTIGLMANFIANGIKGLMLLRSGFLRLTGQSKILGEQTNYLTVEQQNAVAAAASLEQSHMNLQQVFTGEAAAVRQLVAEYQRMVAAQNTAATRFPAMMQPGFKVKGYANGVISVPGPKGAGDIIPAMLSPGEAVIPAKMVEKYGGLINGMVSDSIPGFEGGLGTKTRQVPGAVNPNTFVAAHFTERVPLTLSQIEELLSMPELTKSVREAVMAAQAAGKTVYAYTDSVIALSHSMNEGLKNNIADVSVLRTEISANLEATHVELIRRMRAAGVPEAEIRAAAANISRQILRSLPQAGNIGEAQFNANVRAAYEMEARRSAAVGAAYADMQQFSTLSDPASRGKGGRVSLPARLKASIGGMFFRGGSYRGRRSEFADIISGTGGTYEKQYYALQSQVEKAVDGAVETAERAAQTRSPSRRTIPIGEDIARGLQVGMANQVDETRAVAEKVSNAAVGGLINPKTGLPFGQVAETRRLTAGQINAIAKPLILPGQAQTPKAPLILPGNDFVANNLVDPRTGLPFRQLPAKSFLGMPTMPADPRGPLTEDVINQAYRENRVRNLKAIPGQIGSAAAKGIGKITGAGGGFGLSGLLFGLSMLPGKLGQMAQSIMPVVFGLQSLSMLLRVIGPLPTLLIAMAAGIFMLNKATNKAAEEVAAAAKAEAEARYGSTKAIEQFAEFTGRSLPSAREFSRNNRQLIAASGEAVKRFSDFYAQTGNVAARAINAGAMAGPQAGIRAAAIDVAQRAAIFGLAPEDIAANIKAAADLIGADQVELKAKIQELLAPDGKDITKEPLTITARLDFLKESAEENIKTIGETIDRISKISVSSFNQLAPAASFKDLERVAGYQAEKNRLAQKGGAIGEIQSGLVSIFSGAFGDRFAPQLQEYEKIQGQVQNATTQLSIGFMQQTEALAMLNGQYADGLITKKEYDEQMSISSDNFFNLGESSKTLIEELDKLDTSGELSGAALKDLGNEAFGALKKTNPALFNKITKSLQDLDKNAQIDIMMGYAQGSLTILDVAKLPDLLDKIDGKTIEASIKILAEAGVTAAVLEPQIRKRLKEIDKEIGRFAGRMIGPDQARTIQRLRDEKRSLQESLRSTQRDKEVGQKGALDTDIPLEKTTDQTGKLVDVYEKEIDALRKKREALKDVNSELDRQNQYQMKQMDLINQASRAKISGDFLQAAQLQQQSIFEGAKFARESQELQLDRVINLVEGRRERLQDGGRIVQKDRDLLAKLKSGNYQNIVPMPRTPGIGFNAGATGFAGSTANVGGSMYTITMNISGENATDIANKVMNKLQVLENKRNKSNKVR